MSDIHEIVPNPECRDGKHSNCSGYGWNEVQDEPCDWPVPLPYAGRSLGMRKKPRCRHCGVRIRKFDDRWFHSWHNWQTLWCKEGGMPFGAILETKAEPEEENDQAPQR